MFKTFYYENFQTYTKPERKVQWTWCTHPPAFIYPFPYTPDEAIWNMLTEQGITILGKNTLAEGMGGQYHLLKSHIITYKADGDPLLAAVFLWASELQAKTLPASFPAPMWSIYLKLKEVSNKWKVLPNPGREWLLLLSLFLVII